MTNLAYERTTRRLVATLFATQSAASAAFIAAVTVNPILGTQLSGRQTLAGLPATVLLIGAATAAYPMGRLMQQVGRRPGLALGFLAGLVGALLAVVAVVSHIFVLFLVAVFCIGAARGTLDQSRYAAADASPAVQRGKAISTVVFAGTVGAVVGPMIVPPLSAFATTLNVDPLAGPFVGGALLFALGGIIVMTLLYPDPRTLGQQLAAEVDPLPQSAVLPPAERRSFRTILRLPTAQVALTAMVIGQATMVLVMTVTSVYMYNNDHNLRDVSLVISAHTLGMFGLSVVTGWLADQIGRQATICVGALLIIAGASIAPFSLLTPWLALGLFLVGLGWNFCYIAGSSLLADTLAAGERGGIQGASDLLINAASATASLSSGFILAALGYGSLCAVAAVVASIPLLMVTLRGRTAQPDSTLGSLS